MEQWSLTSYVDKPIQQGSYVVLESEQGETFYVLIAPVGARQLWVEHQRIQVVNLSTPLAQALLNQQEGDEVQLTLSGKKQRWEIVSCQ